MFANWLGRQSNFRMFVISLITFAMSTLSIFSGFPAGKILPVEASWSGSEVYMSRASVASSGDQAENSSLSFSTVTSDGKYVLFSSNSSNLVTGDTNGMDDIFKKDMLTGDIERISIDSAGNEALFGGSWNPVISSDQRYVAFESMAKNLVSSDTNNVTDIFRKDLQTGELVRVSVDSNGNQGNGGSGGSSISSDGRYVAFHSFSILTPGDTNGTIDIFRKDLLTGEIVRVSTDSSGNEAIGNHSWNPSMSSDGRYITFYSPASNLVAGDSNNSEDIFRKDLLTGELLRVSTDNDGVEANGISKYPSLSSDGRYVAFTSWASNLVNDDTNNWQDIFRKDMQTGELVRASENSSDNQVNNGSDYPSISANGQFVAYSSAASNLVSDDTNGKIDIFRKDLQNGGIVRVSIDSSGNQAIDDNSGYPSISADGRFVSFNSYVSNLVIGDTNGVADIFLADMNLHPSIVPPDTLVPNVTITNPLEGQTLSGLINIEAVIDDSLAGNSKITEATYQVDNNAPAQMSAADGLFDSPVENSNAQFHVSTLSTGNHKIKVFGKDSAGNWNEGAVVNINVWSGPGVYMSRASVDSSGNQIGNYGSYPSFSSDGRYIAFMWTDNLTLGGNSVGTADIFRKDMQTGEIIKVSTDSSGSQANNDNTYPSFSSDGRYVSFMSYSSNLISNDTNGASDIYRKDLQTGEIVRVSTDLSGNQANSWSYKSSISSDGRYVSFESYASNLVAGDTNGRKDIFRKDLQTGEIIRASTASDGSQANDENYHPSISSDGRFITFFSDASSLITEDTNNARDIFRKDMQTAEVLRVSVDSSGSQANGDSLVPSISSDGRYIAFNSDASNLVYGDTNGYRDTFRKDMQTGEIVRVSTDSSGNQANNGSAPLAEEGPSISSDGTYVAFRSQASNLVSNDTIPWDIFRKNLQTGEILRMSIDSAGNQANHAYSYTPVISLDGRYVAFVTYSSNLVPGDTNNVSDVFLADANLHPSIVPPDTLVPNVTITNPLEGQTLSGLINIEAVIDDSFAGNSKITEATYQVDNNAPVQMSAADGSFNSPVENVEAQLETTTLSDGLHTISVKGRDYIGNWSDLSQVTIMINNFDLIAKIIYPDPESPQQCYSGVITVTGIAKLSDKTKFSKYVLQYQKTHAQNGTAINNPVWTTIASSNEMINNATLGKWNTAGLVGMYKLRLSVYDINGNAWTDTKYVRIDSLKPAITPIYPEITSFKAFSINTFQALIEDYSSITDAKFFINDRPATSSFNSQEGVISHNPEAGEIINGKNTITIIATDSAGNHAVYTYTFIFDKIGPEFDITGPASGSTFSGKKRIPISGFVKSLSLKKWSIKYHIWDYEGFKKITIASGTNSTNGETILGYLPTLSPGEYEVELSVSDGASDWWAAMIDINIDGAASYDDLTSIDSANILGKKLVVQGSSSSNDFSSYKLFLKQTYPIIGSETLIYSSTVPAVNGLLFSKDITGNGTYDLILKTYKSTGEVSSDTYSNLKVDTALPKIISTNPVDANYISDSTPTLKINASDPEPVKGSDTNSGLSDTANITVDGILYNVPLDTSSYSLTLPELQDGEHKVSAKISDLSGNSVNKQFSFYIDTDYPILFTENLINNQSIKSKYTVKGMALDKNISSYQLQIKTESPSSSWSSVAVKSENVGISGASLAIFDTTKLNGKYYVRLIAKDKAGNTSYFPEQSEFDYQQAIPVLIDNKAPILKTIYPAVNSYLKGLSSIYISGAYDLNPLKTTTGTAGINDEKIMLKLNGEEIPVAYSTETSKITYELNEPLSDGVHNAQFTVPDNTGNAAIMKTNFTIDSTYPTAELSLARSSIKAGNKLTIAGKAKDKNIASWALYQKHSSATVYTKLASGTGGIGNTVYSSTFYTWAPAKTGAYILKLDVKDKAGNISTVIEDLTVDNSSGYQNLAEISYPANDQIIKGKIPIIGSASTSSNFAYYTVSRKLSTSSTEPLIYKSSVPVEGGKLATFDATKLNGTYDVVLRRYTNPAAPTEYGSAVSITNLKIDNTVPIVASISAITGQSGQPGFIKSNTPTIEIKAKESGSGIDETKTTVLLDGLLVPLDFSETGNASFNSESNIIYVTLQQLEDAKHSMSATVYDKAGNKSKTFTYNFTTDTDDWNVPTQPNAQITSPAESTIVKGTVPIVGSAFDQNLYNYTLSYRKLGSASFTTFFTSITNVLDATVGSFKSTLVTDGQYDIKLTVTDKALNVPKEAIITVFVDNIL